MMIDNRELRNGKQSSEREYTIAGKTGFSRSVLPWRNGGTRLVHTDSSLLEEPKYEFTVFVESGGSGQRLGSSAGSARWWNTSIYDQYFF
jgi:hypothetical protein